MGLTPGQVRRCLSWQATILAMIGTAIGVPLGIALGRSWWHSVAEATPLVYVEPFALVGVVVAVVGALALANLLALWPGRQANRLRPAEVLRTE